MPRIVPSFDAEPRDRLRDLLAAALVIAALSVGSEILVPAALAILLSFVLAPGVRFLRRRRLGRVLPVLLMTVLAFLLIGALAALLASQLLALADEMPRYQSTVVDKVETLRAIVSGPGMSRFSEFLASLGQHLHGGSLEAPGPAGRSAPVPVVIAQAPQPPLEVLARYLMPALHPLAVAGLVAIYAVFILLAREDLRNRAIRLFGAGDIHRSTAAIDEAARRLSRYLLTQLAVNATAGAATVCGLWAIGVPSPILWGIVFGCLRFVPYLGPPLGAAAPLALAAAASPGWSPVMETAAFLVVLEAVLGQVVEPLLYGHNTGLSPLAVVIAATFWTVLWGPVGLVLSTPLTVCMVVLGRHVDQLGFLAVMLGDAPALEPAEIFYQRMLAGDPIEASDLAEQQLKDATLGAYYDGVLVPGLLLAQEDVEQGRLDAERQVRIAAAAAEVVDNLSDSGADPEDAAARGLPEAWRRAGAVLCLGAHRPLDDVVAGAAAQLLARRGFGVLAATHDGLRRGEVDRLPVDDARLVLLSCLDGEGSVLRFALRRLRRRRPGVPVLVGTWGRESGGDADGGRDAVATLAEAVARAVAIADEEGDAARPAAAVQEAGRA